MIGLGKRRRPSVTERSKSDGLWRADKGATYSANSGADAGSSAWGVR